MQWLSLSSMTNRTLSSSVNVILGADAASRILVVVYSWRGDDIRLISARRAEPHERKEYENQ